MERSSQHSLVQILKLWKYSKVKFYLAKICDYTCAPIRKKCEMLRLPVDISPLLVILLITLFKILW